MPRKPMDYSNTHFYKIICRDLNIKDCYVGHTTNFSKRKNAHKNNCVKNNSVRLYSFIRENGGFNNFDMILIDIVKCDNRLEALKKEREYIEVLQASLNQLTPVATDEDKLKQSTDDNYRKRQDRLDNPEN
jgi:predicted GIY-YIG superfamily endonuclease